MTHRQNAHLDPETLLQLDQGLVEGDRATWMREHLKQCHECKATHAAAREMFRRIGAVPDEDGSGFWRGLLRLAVTEAWQTTDDERLEERLAFWNEEWPGQAEVAVRIRIGRRGGPASFTSEGLHGIELSGAPWCIPADPPRRTFHARDAGEVGAPVAREIRGARSLQVIAGPGRAIEVIVTSVTGGAVPPVVMLIPEDGGPAHVAALQPSVEGYVAVFEGLEAAEWLLALAPTASRPRS